MTAPFFTGIPTAPIQGGGSPLAGGIGDGGMFPPHLYPPKGSLALNLQDSAALVGAIGSISTPAGLQTRIAANQVGTIAAIEILLDGITITSNVDYRLLINGSIVPGWVLTIPPRNGATSVSKSWGDGQSIGIEIPQGADIGFQILNNDGGAGYTVGVSVYGWTWPAQR